MPGKSLEAIPNFLSLSDRIGTAGQPDAEQFTAVKEAGYQVVINLRPNVPEALQNEREIVTSQGMEYIQIPVVWDQPTEEDVEKFFEAMQEHANKKVFVHCAMNMRVSAFLYLYRILRQKAAAEEAARDLHRIWTPNPTWQRLIEQVLEQSKSPSV
jgi:protein tyrosine phosphatase (PTP) superfamily phosphohydrolase (DUF442 family)